ncbi:MAG: hypothetical protein K0S81_3305, partial [Rhodospirillales bacterium]|nr:hypothetical protein [Rhodospirillales bacterium]
PLSRVVTRLRDGERPVACCHHAPDRLACTLGGEDRCPRLLRPITSNSLLGRRRLPPPCRWWWSSALRSGCCVCPVTGPQPDRLEAANLANPPALDPYCRQGFQSHRSTGKSHLNDVSRLPRPERDAAAEQSRSSKSGEAGATGPSSSGSDRGASATPPFLPHHEAAPRRPRIEARARAATSADAERIWKGIRMA